MNDAKHFVGAQAVTDIPAAFSPSESAELLVLAERIGRIGVIDWDVRAGTVRLSASAQAMYGLTEFDGRYDSWIATVHREDVTRLRAIIATALEEKAREFELDFRIIRPSDNELRWILARRLVFYDEAGSPFRVVGVSVDVTQSRRELVELRNFTEALEAAVKERTRELEAEHEARKRAEDALRQAQKMEAMGQLTGGIAHDFNNMLAIVIGSLDIASRRLRRGEADVERYLESARTGAMRAATLTQRLLAFSRQSPLAPRVLNLNELVASMSELLHRTLGERVGLETVLAGGLWLAHADPNQLESAILNLAVNARDAMPDGGNLTIETGNVYLDDRYAADEIGVTPGQYVMVAVTDVGAGIAPDILQKVFDPFFTTKPTGKGTGLGLSMVYGFAKQSGGHVRIYSELGRGTAVKLYLPRHFGSLAEATARSRGPALPTAAARTETVLVVEDEDRVRQMSCEVLRELGYTVHEASSGEQALRLFNSLGRVDVLFTDVVMPGMTGRQLADTLLQQTPTLKVLYTTGYTKNAVVHNGVLDHGVAFLPKPFTVEDLAVKLRAVLDA
jgi:signal transduction histidine kinase